MVDIWRYLAQTDKPIVMYGTGNGGDKIINEAEKYGIKLSGIFASDGFVRERSFRDIKVESYSNIVSRLGEDIIIIIAFGSSRPEVLEIFAKLASRHEVLVPDVPVAGGEVWNAEFVEKYSEQISLAENLFEDEESRVLFRSLVDYRNTGKIKNLFENLSDSDAVMNTVLRPNKYEITADLGAYTGDTALELLEYSKSVKTIIAVEPDSHNFGKLCINTASTGKVEPHFTAAWDKSEILTFSKGGGRGIRSSNGKTVEVAATPLDKLTDGRKIDYIKYDVEGSEKEAILGSLGTIGKYHPDLQVALYHKAADIFEIPLMLKNMFPFYKFYLRRYLSVPGWDINLFAVGDGNE